MSPPQPPHRNSGEAAAGDEVVADDALTTKEGWRRFVDRQPRPCRRCSRPRRWPG